MKVLLGVADFGETEVKQMIRAAEAQGIQITSSDCRYTKQGIMQYLEENPDTDVVILSEAVEGKAPFEPSDFETMSECYENVRIIAILMNERRGTEYVKDVFHAGVFNAIFSDDADISLVLRLMENGRSRKEAKVYYKLKDVDDIGNAANIAKCIRHIEEAPDRENMRQRIQHIHRMLSEDEFTEVVKGLDAACLEVLVTIPGLENLAAVKSVSEEKPSKGSLSSLAGVIAEGASDFRHIVANKASKEIVQPDPIPKHLSLSALSMDDLFNIISNVIVGFVGNQRRCGTTHQAITAAHYLASKGYRVALADCSAKRGKGLTSFEAIERYRDTTPMKDGFVYLGVHYFKDVTTDTLNKVFSAKEKFHFVIIDYGTFSPYVKEDIGRCSIKCAVCGSMPWEVNQLRAFADDTKFLRGQMIYLIRGVAEDTRESQQWLDGIIDEYRFADVQEDPFNGDCYPALAHIFDKYVCGLPEKQGTEPMGRWTIFKTRKKFGKITETDRQVNIMQKEKALRGSEALKDGRGRKARIGTDLCFVTSLRHGCGATYVSAGLANVAVRRGETACIITDEEDLTPYIHEDVGVYPKSKPYDRAFADYDHVIIDAGIWDEMPAKIRKESERATGKLMVCASSEDYFQELAGFVSSQGDVADEWQYIFNRIPPADVHKVKQLMGIYAIQILPVGNVVHPSKEVKKIFNRIL